MKVIVDAMGGDNAPLEIVKGAIDANRELGVDIILTGKVEEVLRAMEKLGMKELPKGVEIANATEVITMDDDPATAVRRKKDSSMAVGLRMLHEGVADAMVSAGSTGALISGATLVVKRVRGIRRAALAPVVPCKGGEVVIIDSGANAECTPEYLLQFAFMGSYYMSKVRGVENPRVGLLNIGAEETKGTSLQVETYRLLTEQKEQGRINFVGNIEGRDVALGACDVLVCDGFAGNILLKSMEGFGSFILSELKGIFVKNVKTKLAAAMVMDDVKALKKKFDASEVGGTPLLGITKPVIKAHGSSDARAIRNAVRQAIQTVKGEVCEDIARNVEHMRISAPAAQAE